MRQNETVFETDPPPPPQETQETPEEGSIIWTHWPWEEDVAKRTNDILS